MRNRTSCYLTKSTPSLWSIYISCYVMPVSGDNFETESFASTHLLFLFLHYFHNASKLCFEVIRCSGALYIKIHWFFDKIRYIGISLLYQNNLSTLYNIWKAHECAEQLFTKKLFSRSYFFSEMCLFIKNLTYQP